MNTREKCIKNNKKEVLRNIGLKVINIALISIIIFYPFNPLFIIYFLSVSLIWIGTIINFALRKNSVTYLNFIIIAFTNLLIGNVQEDSYLNIASLNSCHHDNGILEEITKN